MDDLISVLEETNIRLDGIKTLIDICAEFFEEIGRHQNDIPTLLYLVTERRTAYEVLSFTAGDYIKLIQKTLDAAMHTAGKT